MGCQRLAEGREGMNGLAVGEGRLGRFTGKLREERKGDSSCSGGKEWTIHY